MEVHITSFLKKSPYTRILPKGIKKIYFIWVDENGGAHYQLSQVAEPHAQPAAWPPSLDGWCTSSDCSASSLAPGSAHTTLEGLADHPAAEPKSRF